MKFKFQESLRAKFQVSVMTNKGLRELYYIPYIHKGNSDKNNRLYIDYNFGVKSGEWHTFRRNISNDLFNKDPELQLIYILHRLALTMITISNQ